MKGLFLDLDSTIIETKSGNTFSTDKNDWKFRKGILPKLRKYYKEGWKLIIVTNQGGISNGLVRPNDFSEKINTIVNNIQTYLTYSYFQRSIESDTEIIVAVADAYDEYRKPSPKIGLEIAETWNIDLSESLMVGDASGLKKYYTKDKIFTGYNKPDKWDYYKEDFSDSDKKFAENLGMKYLDIEKFLK